MVLYERLDNGVTVAVVPEELSILLDTPLTVNMVVVIVDVFIDLLNVAVIAVFTPTPVAPSAGVVNDTVGAPDAEPVVKLHEYADAIALPALSFTPVESVAV